MIKLGTKIPGPFATGVRYALFNLAATLFVLVVGVIFIGKQSSSGVEHFFLGLLLILTFPANLFDYSFTTATGGMVINVFFLNPLIWGLAAFFIHRVKNAGALERKGSAAEKFNGPACVSCGAPTDPDSELCPQCGWTQPR